MLESDQCVSRLVSFTRSFWEGLSQHKLLGQSCPSCDEKFFPPRPYCPECLADQLDWIELDTRGTLHSWTQVRVAGPEFDTPFLLGLVDLSGGIGRAELDTPFDASYTYGHLGVGWSHEGLDLELSYYLADSRQIPRWGEVADGRWVLSLSFRFPRER